MQFSQQSIVTSLSGCVDKTFVTFNTDVPGIRIKKFDRMVRHIQQSIPYLKCDKGITLESNGFTVLIEKHYESVYKLTVGGQSFFVDQNNVYDGNGKVTKAAFLSPRIFTNLLA